MEIHQLRYFVAVAEEGSFSRAAERMHVAQPSLSQQMQKLEAEIGHSLFDRLPRRVSLTEAGRQLLPYARRILSGLLDAQRCVDELASEPSGTVAIGIIPTIAPYVLRAILQEARDQIPQVRLTVREDLTENLVRALDEGEIDFAVVSTCRSGSGIYRETWATEPLVVAVPAKHRLAQRRRIAWKDLQSETLLLLNESHCLAQQVGRWCDRHGMRASTQLDAFQLSTVLALVAADQGVSLVPVMAIAHEPGWNCAFVKLRSSIPFREINVIRNPARFWSKATAALSEIARTVVAKRLSTAELLHSTGATESSRNAGIKAGDGRCRRVFMRNRMALAGRRSCAERRGHR
jgi:LysR family transcriptional regulator, hydrogen peroxide-inducible genes activator